jgi:hypothetical protein
MPFPLLDAPQVYAIHQASLEYTVRIQTAASKKAEGETTNLVARAAISVLMHDMACLHQAVRDVCRCGWAFASPILLRSMLESAMSIAIIIANDRPDLTGFKYLYAKVSEEGQDPKTTGLVAEEERINIETHFSQMTPEDREAAKKFLEARPVRRFWYTGMYSGPTEIIRKHMNPELLGIYEVMSIAAHGGFIGSRLFRDDPEKLDINPRKQDFRSQGFAMISGSRVLIEATHLRERFEDFRDGGYAVVMTLIAACAEG